MKNFESSWEPTLLKQKTIASGIWWYQNKIPYRAELIKQAYNYSSKDIIILDEILYPETLDCIDYNISDEGILYFWKFKNGENESFSKSFSTYFTARDHLSTYEGKTKINWSIK